MFWLENELFCSDGWIFWIDFTYESQPVPLLPPGSSDAWARLILRKRADQVIATIQIIQRTAYGGRNLRHSIIYSYL